MRDRLPALRFVALSFLMGRGGLVLVVLLARAWVPERAPNPEKDFVAFPDLPLWDSFCRWDSGWYDRVARLGYERAGGPSDVAFFPAFPYLSRWLGPLFGGHFAAGLVLANASLFGALLFVHALGERHAGKDGGRRAVWLVLLYPATIFYSAYYTEGLFFLSACGAFYFYEEDRMLPAGLLGGLAAMTRPTGVLLFPALLLGVLRRSGWRPRAISPRALALCLIPLGLAVFMFVLAREVGDPLAFLRAEGSWGRAPTMPFITLWREIAALESAGFIGGLDLVAALGMFVVAFFARRKIDLAHALFALGCVALPLFSGRARSIERYSATVPAVFLVLSRVTRRAWVERAVLVLLGGLMAVQAALFAGWYWAG